MASDVDFFLSFSVHFFKIMMLHSYFSIDFSLANL